MMNFIENKNLNFINTNTNFLKLIHSKKNI